VGIPGPVCRALQEAYYRKMQRECTGNLQKDYQSDLQSDLQTDPQGTLPGNDSFQSE